jgi:hypothetical protein
VLTERVGHSVAGRGGRERLLEVAPDRYSDGSRYWAILEQLMDELGYRDYLGAPQKYRVEHPTDIPIGPPWSKFTGLRAICERSIETSFPMRFQFGGHLEKPADH